MEAYIEALSDVGVAPAEGGVLVTDQPRVAKRSLRGSMPLFRGVVPFGARPAAPAVIWFATCAAALAAGELTRNAAIVIVLGGAAFALTSLRGSMLSRLLTAAALAPGAIAPSALAGAFAGLTWVLAGALVAAVAASRGGPIVLRSHDLKRHIDWCRRRQEPAHVLVMSFAERDLTRPSTLMESFRLTDSVALTSRHGTCELQAVIDDHDFSRPGLERRLTDQIGTAVKLGWATFPVDGVTLNVLTGAARHASTVPERDARPLAHAVTESLATA